LLLLGPPLRFRCSRLHRLARGIFLGGSCLLGSCFRDPQRFLLGAFAFGLLGDSLPRRGFLRSFESLRLRRPARCLLFGRPRGCLSFGECGRGLTLRLLGLCGSFGGFAGSSLGSSCLRRLLRSGGFRQPSRFLLGSCRGLLGQLDGGLSRGLFFRGL
jgi:hypothetical protein